MSTTGLPARHAALGARIQAARKRSGLSHDKLGARVGTSRQHLIKLERGYHRPSDDLLARIAEATGQPLTFFVDDSQEAAPSGEPFRAEDGGAGDRGGAVAVPRDGAAGARAGAEDADGDVTEDAA